MDYTFFFNIADSGKCIIVYNSFGRIATGFFFLLLIQNKQAEIKNNINKKAMDFSVWLCYSKMNNFVRCKNDSERKSRI